MAHGLPDFDPSMCPVCGFPELAEPPRYPSGGGSNEICPSCGFEFGYTDDDLGFTYDQWRAKWINEGMPWKGEGQPPPPAWDPAEQLKKIG